MTAVRPPSGATPLLARGSRRLAADPDLKDEAGHAERPRARPPAWRRRSPHTTPSRSGRRLVSETAIKVAGGAIGTYVLAHLDTLMDFLRELIGATL